MQHIRSPAIIQHRTESLYSLASTSPFPPSHKALKTAIVLSGSMSSFLVVSWSGFAIRVVLAFTIYLEEFLISKGRI